MSEAYRCPYCLQHVAETAETTLIAADGPLAGFLGVEEDTAVHEVCYRNVADRA
jgi:hypothetical protein